MINKDGFKYNYNTRSRFQNFRLILITSLFWVLVDAFLMFYLTDCSSSSASVSLSLQNSKLVESNRFYELELEKLRLELRNLKQNSSPNQNQNKINDDETILKNRNNRLHNVHKIRQQKQQEKIQLKAEVTLSSTSSTSSTSPNQNESKNFLKKLKEWFSENGDATNPASWHGEKGRAVQIPAELKDEAKKRFRENQFNIVASDLIALNRSVSDQRSHVCKKREYPTDLPTTSIIIVFHNEGNSTLLRGLTSIIRKSPLKYLKEIILVDDASEAREYLHGQLDQFLKTLPLEVKIFRNAERMGLMRSRLRGANAAQGDTMTFLDAHIEATDGWLQPLLNEIKQNRKSIACPVIDVISDETFEYLTGSEMTYGGFDSHFVFDWIPVPARENERRKNDYSLALRTPTMAGGLFTIDRNYFYELGAYDEGMDVWGAENLEMSFRIWMCGGQLLILPCSHVGHVFRKQTPYSFPGGTNKVIFKNNRRLIDVWTDDYSKYFHKIIPDLNSIDAGDMSKRIELRKNLNCKSFKWFLDNIYPEAPLPKDFYHVGSIQNIDLNHCMDTLNRKSGEEVGSSYCHGQGGNQVFEYSKNHNLVSGNLCLDSSGSHGPVKLSSCHHTSKNQQWDYDNLTQLFRNRYSSACLSISESNSNQIVTKSCDKDDKHQKWLLKDSIFTSLA